MIQPRTFASRVLLVPMMVLAAIGVRLHAQSGDPSNNLVLFDHLNPVSTDSVGPSSALWGYTAPNGREYALVGTQIGTHIIDITEKPIRQVAYIFGPKSSWREMKIYQQRAYIVTESSDSGWGLQIVDLSQLPTAAPLIRTDTSLFRRAHSIFINSHYMYINGTQADAGANGGVIIYDLEPDPLHPRRIGMASPYYYHDSWERNDTLVGAAIYGQGCDLYDVRDRTQPKLLANISYPFSGTHNAEITADGGYVLTSDEIGTTPKTMKVWDIHDLNNIRKVAEYTPNLNDIVHNVHVRGRYVIAAWYTAGVRIIDMIDPIHPREVGYYDTYPGNSGGYNGVWEAYGFFPSGKVIAGDRQTGLYVLTFNYATAGSISGVVRNRMTGEPLVGAPVTIGQTFTTVKTDAQGRYYVGGPIGSPRTLTVAPFGFAGHVENDTIAGDAQHDILLDPLEFNNATVTAISDKGDTISDFAYAVVPYFQSAYAPGTTATLLLPRDSVYTLVTGKWGYRVVRTQVQLTGKDQQIVVTLPRGYYDDATLDLGWSFAATGDNATTGRWTRLVPYIAFAGSDWIFPPVEPSGDASGYVFQTGAPAMDSPPQNNDINGGRTSLTTPVMDLHNFVNPTFEFDLWCVHYKKDTVRDSLRIDISSDDGASWYTLYTEAEGRSGWKTKSLPITGVPLTTTMRMRVRASDSLSNAFFFAGLDNFLVTGGPPAAVPWEQAASALGTLAAFPNPMDEHATVEFRIDEGLPLLRVELYSMAGDRVAVLHDGPIGAGQKTFSIGAGLPDGCYMLRAIDGMGRRWNCSVVVQR